MFMSMPTASWSRGWHNGQDRQSEGLVPGAAGISGGGVLGRAAVDDGRELFDAGYVWQQSVLLEWCGLVQGTARSVDRSGRPVSGLAGAQPVLLGRNPGD